MVTAMYFFFKNVCFVLAVWVTLGTLSGADAGGQLVRTKPLPAEEGKLAKFWLEEVWDKGTPNNEKSVRVYEAASPQNSDVVLAYAVNRLQHRRTTEAAVAVEAAKASDPNNIDAVVLSIWLEALQDNFDVALIGMQNFANIVAKTKMPPQALDVPYRRLGRLLGYLQGPVAGRCNPDIFARSVERLNNGIAKRHQEIVEQESQAVIAKYDQLLKELSQKVHASIQKNAVSDQVKKTALEKQNDVLEAQSEQIQQQRELLQQQAQQEISAISQNLPGLEAELDAAILEIDAVRSQIAYNRSLLLLERNNVQVPLLANNFNAFQIQQSFLVLNNLRANANRIANTIALEQNKIDRVRTAYNARLSKLNRDIKKTTSLKQRNSNKLVAIAEGPEPDPGAVAALNNRTSPLSIYDPLPLEQYRADFRRRLR